MPSSSNKINSKQKTILGQFCPGECEETLFFILATFVLDSSQ